MIKIQTLLWQTNTLNTWFPVGFKIHVKRKRYSMSQNLCTCNYSKVTIFNNESNYIYKTWASTPLILIVLNQIMLQNNV